MGQPRAKTGANLRPNRANIGQQQQQGQPQQQQHQHQHQQQQQPRAKTGANLRPNRANIGQQQQRQQQQHQNMDMDYTQRIPSTGLLWPAPGCHPAPVSLPEAFGGNRRLYTAAAPAADHLRSIPPHPRSTIIVVIYSVFCVWCSKNIVFYRVLWPSPSPGFILATLKNHGFFKVLGLRKGSGTENWTS